MGIFYEPLGPHTTDNRGPRGPFFCPHCPSGLYAHRKPLERQRDVTTVAACRDSRHFPSITFVRLSGSIRSGNAVAARPPGPRSDVHMCPLPSVQGPSFAPSEQVTPSARPFLNLLQSRASIPPVLVLHPALAGDKCARPAQTIADSNLVGFS